MFDGDIICTINNHIMIAGKQEGNPIMYESLKAEKAIVDSRDDKEQVESQLLGHDSKVGYATNVSSSLYSWLENFPLGSREREVLLNRLKIGRVIQGEIIDSVKGLKVPPFRQHWVRRTKITENMTQTEKEVIEFNNKIACNRRPMFFRFLYPHYMTRYRKELKRYNNYCYVVFGKSFDEIYKHGAKTAEEQKIVDRYKKRSFFIDNASVMNLISLKMNDLKTKVGKYSLKSTKEFDYELLIDRDIPIDEEKLEKMKTYMGEYRDFKLLLRNKKKMPYSSLEAFSAMLRKKAHTEISSNESELANYAVMLTYGDKITMVEFPWNVFSSGLLENLIKNSNEPVVVPVWDKDGDVEYLWGKYKMIEIPMEALYENK